MTKLLELATLGQSIWLDYIRRGFLVSGALQDLIKLGVRGMTSNPTIFEKAIASRSAASGSDPGEYDDDLKLLSVQGKSALQIYEELAIKDIQVAADLLHPVYENSAGEDGYVSLEVNPTKAHQTGATVEEAKRLWNRVSRPNLMIKIPATKEGLPAITQAIFAGINVNVTLIFSIKRYQEVMEAYLQGLEKRAKTGQSLRLIASVASFFVSRVDAKVDPQLDAIVREEKLNSGLASSLFGKAAVANAKLAYRMFQDIFNSPRFIALQEKGARPQRPLWASTSTKNPAYSDILYVQELIGALTVNTLPQNTLEAFLDHGEVRETITENVDEARTVIDELENLGISMDTVTNELEDEGVAAFSRSFVSLLGSIDKRQKELTPKPGTISFDLGSSQSLVDQARHQTRQNDIVGRIWRGDHTVWKPEPTEIANRLGWLHVHEEMMMHIPQLEAVQYAVQVAGYTHCIVLGMGGSSLAPDLFGKIFKANPGEPGLQVEVLDSTDPAAVRALASRLNPHTTIFIVSTKSGTTEETLSFFKFFYNWTVNALGVQNAGDHFIAITDPGSKLVEVAKSYHFRSVFLNDPNIGGRYSALSYFGLVPAALAGVDLKRLLDRASKMASQCKQDDTGLDNPAIQLGAALGELAKIGNDKVTFFLPPQISSFGDWVEQLIAESTGKEGQGILPVAGESPGSPDSYDQDRLFIFFDLDRNSSAHPDLEALKAKGFPIIQIKLEDIYDLGGQFFLWEFATAVAGHWLGIQPFDQPNVEAAKILARDQIAAYKNTGRLPDPASSIATATVKVFGETPATSPEKAILHFIQQAKPGDYIALQAFLTPTRQTDEALQQLRENIRKATRRATTLGYGPRYLHSTGQLHKGDSGDGLFIQFTMDNSLDLAIPDIGGQPETSVTFGILINAQAIGDQQALQRSGRRIIRIHLMSDVPTQLIKLANAIPV